jgi:hypothetical protein
MVVRMPCGGGTQGDLSLSDKWGLVYQNPGLSGLSRFPYDVKGLLNASTIRIQWCSLSTNSCTEEFPQDEYQKIIIPFL